MYFSNFRCTQDRVHLFSIFIGLIYCEGVIEGSDVRCLERRSFGLNRLNRWLLFWTTARHISADINLDFCNINLDRLWLVLSTSFAPFAPFASFATFASFACFAYFALLAALLAGLALDALKAFFATLA